MESQADLVTGDALPVEPVSGGVMGSGSRSAVRWVAGFEVTLEIQLDLLLVVDGSGWPGNPPGRRTSGPGSGSATRVVWLKPLGLDLRKIASAFGGVAVLLLVARLAFNIGPSLSTLLKAGPALLLQELGHLLGTIALALPLAVLLKMARSTVGATFSLDREPAFAIVGEKYGRTPTSTAACSRCTCSAH